MIRASPKTASSAWWSFPISAWKSAFALTDRAVIVSPRDDGLWNSSLCQQINAQELHDAAQPFPAPDGEGPIKMLVGGSWGEMGIVALDSQGRTLAYGERVESSSWLVAAPPHHRHPSAQADIAFSQPRFQSPGLGGSRRRRNEVRECDRAGGGPAPPRGARPATAAAPSAPSVQAR